ncbi:MAG: response regulator [Gammaproteobacteria bacterium]|nr:response regulator [Gammaproteobacteria bacterium]
MKRILVVEDTDDNLEILQLVLEREGYAVLQATDGLQGVAMAINEQPDLVLMDIRLPEIDGYEATRRIKADPRSAKIPIVAVTSYAISGDRKKCMDAGCDDYITKPYLPPDLVAMIRKHIG